MICIFVDLDVLKGEPPPHGCVQGAGSRAQWHSDVCFQAFQCLANCQAACNVLSIGYGLQIANAAVLMTNLFGASLRPASAIGDGRKKCSVHREAQAWPARSSSWRASTTSGLQRADSCCFRGCKHRRAADTRWLPFAMKTSVILNGGIVVARSAWALPYTAS